MMNKRMAVCIFLAALMICLFLAPAFAEQTERNLMMGTSGLADYDSVFIGNHWEESPKQDERTDFKWQVIPYSIFTNDQTKLTLFSQYVISPFDSVGAGNNFMKTLPDHMFSAAERDAMPSLSSPDKWSIDRLYYQNKSIAGIGISYWTSDVEAWSSSYILDWYVDKYGATDTLDDKDHTSICDVRPVGNLTKANVLFTSKVAGGKTSGSGTGNTFVSTAKQTNEDINTWRFTLKDQARNGFAITSAELNENQVTVHYTGAQTGTNEYISAIITDGGNTILYYGRIKLLGSTGDANGEVTIICPEDVTLGANRRLYVFNEQYNGGENDTQTVSDYASDLLPVNLVVSFDTLGHGSAPEPQSILYGQKVVQSKAPSAAGKVFGSWCKHPAGTQPWDFDYDTVTEDIILYAKWDDPIDFSLVPANGSDMEATTALTLSFVPAVTGLTEEDVTLTGAQKGTLTENSDGTYTLNLSDISVPDQGNVNVAVTKRGYHFSPATRDVTVRNHGYTAVNFASVTANGSDTEFTTALTLTFSMDITGLTADDITLTGAQKGTLTENSDGTYTLGISDIIGGDNTELTVAVAKSGFVFTPAKRTVTVRNHGDLTPVAFDSVTANGWDGATTSLLTLTFSQDINGLSAEDIILTGANKGTLTKVEGTTGQYTLSILDVKVIDTDLVTVEVAKSGFAFSPASRKVAVRKYTPTPVKFLSVEADGNDNTATTKFTLTFDQDIEGLTADDITLSRSKKLSLQRIGEGTYELSVNIKVNDELTENVRVEKLGYAFTPDNHDVVVRNPHTFITSDLIRLTLAANGGDAETTTALFLWFNLPVGGFTEEHLELTGATKGQMVKINDYCYRLPITNITVEDHQNVQVHITGKRPYVFYSYDYDVAVRNCPPDEIEFRSVTANGSDEASTTELTLQLSLDVPELSAANIILTGADKGELTKVEGETGRYILKISNLSVPDQGKINVALLKSGFAFFPVSSQDVTVRNHAEYTQVEFTSVEANPSSSGTTTELILHFNQDISGLTAEDITLTGAAKGVLQNGNATGEYRLGISNLTVPHGGEVTVSVAKNGYVFSPATKKTTVSNSTAFKPVEFFSANPADGSETSSTTKIVLTFAQDIDGLTADDITLSGAQKGKLTKRSHSTGIYELEITNITVPHNEFISVTMAKEGFVFSPESHYVVIHDPIVYPLTVTDGWGSGNYQKDMVVTISANAAPAGKSFQEWTWDDADDLTFIAGSKNSSTAMILMPGHEITLTATYKNAPGNSSPKQGIMLGTDGLYQLDHVRFVNKWTILPEGIFGGYRAHPSDMVITLFSKDVRHRDNMYGCDIPAALEDLEKQFGTVELAAIPFVTGLDYYPDFERFYVPTKKNIEELKAKGYDTLAKGCGNFWLNDRELSNYLWWNSYVRGEQGSIEEVADGGSWRYGSIGLRAVSNITRESVLFVSVPGIKQSADKMVSVPVQPSPYEWRLTLRDQSRSGFQIKSVSLQDNSSSATINYAGAQTGANEYISALILDANGNVQYYGRLKELQNEGDADGSVNLVYPVGSGSNTITPSRNDRFYIFNEKYNGGEDDQGYTPDYASELIPVSVFVTFNTQGNGTAPAEQTVGYGSKAAKPADPSATGKVFDGWFKDAACTKAWDFASDAVTEDMTLYAKWDDPIVFSSVKANGSDEVSTTALTLTFGQDVEGLSASDITLSGADKGELAKVMDKNGEYILYISNITVADHETVTVKVAKDGFVFTPDSQNVSVRKYIPFAKVTAPTAISGLTYNAQLQPLVNAGIAEGGTMMYCLAEDGEYSENIPTGRNAREYTVYYKAVGDASHRDSAVGSVPVSIVRATPQLGTIGYAGPLYANTPGSAVILTHTAITVPGTLKLTVDTLTAGSNQYEWQFVPTDTVNYNTVTGTVLLNVLADELQSIQVSGALQKSVYSYGETFSPAGLTITAHYASSVTEDVTSLVSYNTALTVGQTSVALSYGGKACEVAITVNKAQIAPLNGSLNIVNDRKNTYIYDLSQLLAALDDSKTYGNVSYQLGTIDLGGHYSGGASISGSTLNLPINAVRGIGADVGTIRVKITSDNYAFTDDAVIAVKEGAQIPELEDQPASASYLQGDSDAELKVNANVTDGGTLTYQWYSNTANSNAGGSPISGATSDTCKPSTTTVGTMYYYCVVTNTNIHATGEKTASAVSDAATVTILPAVMTDDADITIIGLPGMAYDSVQAKLMPIGSTAPLHDKVLQAVSGTSPVQYPYHATIADGRYNLVVTAETAGKEVRVTTLIDADTHDAYLPEVGKSSIVDDNSGMGIIAGNVDSVAANYAVTNKDGSLAVTLTTELGYDPVIASHDGSQIIQQAIQDRKTIEVELDIDLMLHQYDSAGNEKDKTDLGDINGQCLEILIPVNATGRVPEGFAVYRVHKGEIQKLPYGVGDEYFTVDIGGKYIKLCVKRFSSYAIGYGEPVQQSLPTPPQTGDNANLALWFAMMGTGLAGITGLFLSRKRKES